MLCVVYFSALRRISRRLYLGGFFGYSPVFLYRSYIVCIGKG